MSRAGLGRQGRVLDPARTPKDRLPRYVRGRRGTAGPASDRPLVEAHFLHSADGSRVLLYAEWTSIEAHPGSRRGR